VLVYRVSTSCRIKKVVLKFLSVNNIVIAPAKTGNDNNNRKAVKIDQAKRGNLWNGKL
jgi:hypothetical protein